MTQQPIRSIRFVFCVSRVFVFGLGLQLFPSKFTTYYAIYYNLCLKKSYYKYEIDKYEKKSRIIKNICKGF